MKKKEEQMALAGTEEGEILARLNERVEKAVSTIVELRRERDSLKARLEEVEGKVRQQDESGERLSTLEQENERFGRERSEIRNRIETILASLESLDEAQ